MIDSVHQPAMAGRESLAQEVEHRSREAGVPQALEGHVQHLADTDFPCHQTHLDLATFLPRATAVHGNARGSWTSSGSARRPRHQAEDTITTIALRLRQIRYPWASQGTGKVPTATTPEHMQGQRN